jgi:hypothetical protein
MKSKVQKGRVCKGGSEMSTRDIATKKTGRSGPPKLYGQNMKLANRYVEKKR